MRPVTLTPRLDMVAKLVPQGARFADVGTDHAYLPIWLIQQGVISRAVASDLREGPLSRARATAEKYGLTDKLSFRLCDGLAGIRPAEADTIAIAGMGGETIASILAAAPWVKGPGYRLLLQPMSAQPELRGWLQVNQFTIVRELLSREGETLYTALLVQPGSMPPLTPAERWAGRQRPGEESPLRGLYLELLDRRAARALEGLRQSSRPGDAPRRREMEEVLRGLWDMEEEWKTWQQ